MQSSGGLQRCACGAGRLSEQHQPASDRCRGSVHRLDAHIEEITKTISGSVSQPFPLSKLTAAPQWKPHRDTGSLIRTVEVSPGQWKSSPVRVGVYQDTGSLTRVRDETDEGEIEISEANSKLVDRPPLQLTN